MVGREVVTLGRVGAQVVELPRRAVEPGLVELDVVVHDRLPTVLVQRAAPEHLGVLHGVPLGRIGRVEAVREADAASGFCSTPSTT